MVVSLLWVYDAISNLAPLRKSTAIDDAEDIWHVERILHIDPESSLNHWLASHHTVGLLVSDYYDNAHFVVTLGVVGWLWWRHHEAYRPLRNALVLTNVIGFVVFWRYPTAPPRLVPGGHIVDVAAATRAIGSWHSGTLATVGNANELASMPSLHIAWAVWSAWAVWQVLPRRKATLAVFLYPVATTYAVLATGNHFLLDVLAGVVTLVLAVLLGDRLPTIDALRTRFALLSGPAPTAGSEPVDNGALHGSVVGGFHPPSTALSNQEIRLPPHQPHLEPGPTASPSLPPPLLDRPRPRPGADLDPLPADH